jgi:RNA polymerase sigma-70 factor (ECF subfamily)
LQTEQQHTIDIEADEQGFDRIYIQHYAALYQYAYTVINDHILAEEMVQQVFLKILEKNGPVMIHTSVKSYLYRAVHNECLNYFKHQRIKQEHITRSGHEPDYHTDTPSGKVQYKELEMRLRSAINELPEQCRIIFQLSRYEELKYAEIALELGISVKTVENQIGKAIKRLRVQLADYLPFVMWFLIFYRDILFLMVHITN